MKSLSSIFITLLCVFASADSVKAQCTSIDYAALQTLQNLPREKKESKILEMGFTLKEGQDPSAMKKTYVKCWQEVGANTMNHYQYLSWNPDGNFISLSTYSKENYLAIRKGIENSTAYKFIGTTDGVDQFESKTYRVSFFISSVNYTITLGYSN